MSAHGPIFKNGTLWVYLEREERWVDVIKETSTEKHIADIKEIITEMAEKLSRIEGRISRIEVMLRK